MKLLTKAIEKAFIKQGNTEDMNPEDVKIIVKFFFPGSCATWYATEYNPETEMFFGFVSLFNDYNDALGYFSLNELEFFRSDKQRFLRVERDYYFGEHTLKEVKDGGRP